MNIDVHGGFESRDDQWGFPVGGDIRLIASHGFAKLLVKYGVETLWYPLGIVARSMTLVIDA